MFGLFKNKKFDFKCPMCTRDYKIKFDPSQVTEFDYQYWGGTGLIGQQACEFCKTEMTLALAKWGQVLSFDEKWEKVRKEHDDLIIAIDDQMTDIEHALEEDENNEKLNNKLQKLETKKEKLEDSFDKKDEKYCDRQSRWGEKWQNKLDRM